MDSDNSGTEFIHPHLSPMRVSAVTDRPQFGGKSIELVLASPPVSQSTVGDEDEEEEVTSLPANYPPVIYPAIGSPSADAPRPRTGGKTIAHMPVRRGEDVEMDDEDGNGSEEGEDESLPPNYPPVIYPTIGSPQAKAAGTPRDVVIEIEDDSDIEEGRGKDESSEVSDGEDLKGDLEDALNGDFDFTGNFAFTKTLSSAPSPGLHIDGIGLIGLPLSERDAQLIAGCAKQAPFGHGERTVVDTAVRDTFEVEPARVKFMNPAWDGYMRGLVTESIWPELLGAGTCTTPPRCELYKLLLYKTGSHFLPHQDTEKADGMFATLIVVLPSLYTGGDVHVSHGTNRKIFKGASINAYTTSMLAWYTDVMHEVKPIESGYRLALSFNLIHTSPGIPRPTLPDMHSAIARLRHVLRKWSKNAYKADMDEWAAEIVAYILDHPYSEVNLKMGALKGKDRHKISNIRGVAEEMGFAVCLAHLKYVESGLADHDGGYSYGHGGGCYDDSDDEMEDDFAHNGMAEISEKTLKLSHLVNLRGAKFKLHGKPLPIRQSNLIPEYYFEDKEPDDESYEGYQGNAAGTLEYVYRRSVLVLFPKAKQVEVLLNAGGVPYALKQARKADPASPTQSDRQTAQYVINRLESQDQATKIAMVDLAVKWNDLRMWKEVVRASGAQKSVDILGKPKFLEAWRKFSFESTCETMENCLTECTSIRARLEFIGYLQAQARAEEHQAVAEWCDAQAARGWTVLHSPQKDDVPAFLTVLRMQGPSFSSEVIVPQLVQFKNIYDFWIELIPALHKLITDSSSVEGTSTSDTSLANAILDRYLSTAFAEWDCVVEVPRPTWSYSRPEAASAPYSKILRICRLISISIQTNRLRLCETLLAMVLASKGDLATTFKTLYTPLIPELRRTLAAARLDMSIQPFAHFSSVLVGSYLENVLGAKPPRNARPANVPKVGCGCADCAALDRFMSSAAAIQTFRYGQPRRQHLEGRLRGAQVTYSTDRTGSPHGLVVKKDVSLLPEENWKVGQVEAKKLLASIGDDTTIAKIMGTRQEDVAKALAGVQHFRMAAGDAAAQPVPITTPAATNLPTGDAPAPQASAPSLAVQSSAVIERAPVIAPAPPLRPISTNLTATQIAGQKRKAVPESEVVAARQKRQKTPEVNGDVIDLTDDSP